MLFLSKSVEINKVIYKGILLWNLDQLWLFIELK